MNTNSTGQQTVIGWHCEGTFPALFTDSVTVAKRWMELGSGVSAMVRQAESTTPAPPAPPAAGDARDLPELNADLIDILGRPNFTCIRIAQLLRLGGVEIAKKAEAEQATVIHYLLGFYFKHGSQWAEKADEDIEQRRQAGLAALQAKGGA